MVTVHVQSTDQITAWRIRDVLACHPLLAGAAVEIQIAATHDAVVVHGWARDARLVQMAVRLARSTAGRRVVHTHLAENRAEERRGESGLRSGCAARSWPGRGDRIGEVSDGTSRAEHS